MLVGTGTALADDPELTCRLPGLEHRSPVRIVIDRKLRLPATLRLIAGARQTTSWVVTLGSSQPPRRAALAALGVKIIVCELDGAGGIDLAALLQILAQRG